MLSDGDVKTYLLAFRTGQEVMKVTSKHFAAELGDMGASKPQPSRIADRVDEETRARLERLRRSRE